MKETVPCFGVFDLETQRSAQEVGGWEKAYKMGISCGCVYDSRTDEIASYTEKDVPALITHLKDLPLVVGFNSKNFDYLVLKGYSDFNFHTLPALDMLESIQKALGYRVSLDNLAMATLGVQKSANGLQALSWWKEGRIDEIIHYCRQDVVISRDLFLYGKKNRHILFTNRGKKQVTVPVAW